MPRIDKVAEAVRQEVSIIIHDKLKDPRLGFVTVTRVEMTPDLRLAKIYFSVLGKEGDYKKTKEALDSALGFVRRLIAERINLRIAPDIMFFEDRSSEYSVRVEEVLNQIKELENKPEPVKAKKKSKKKEGKVGVKKLRRVHKKK